VVYWSNEKAGLEVTIDFAGNIIGKRQGTDDSLKPIDLKSYRHGADGGDYDGCLGSISGLEIMEILNNSYPPSTWINNIFRWRR
jgi:N-carbamoyl-L-amino-acid hydrolase